MTGPVVRSVLKDVIEKLPDDFAMKSQSIPNVLRKQGVTEEELKWAELDIPLGKVTKGDLVQAEQQRKDVWGRVDPATDQYDYVMPEGYNMQNNPTYREEVITFSNQSGPRYNAPHFGQVDTQLAWKRKFDDTFNGVPSRILVEVQSDLHAHGRKYGYVRRPPTAEEVKQIDDLIDEASKDLMDFDAQANLVNKLEEFGYVSDEHGSPFDYATSLISFDKPPVSPWQDNYVRKLLEDELVQTFQQGREQLVVPLTGPHVETLARGKNQDIYTNTVYNTMRKMGNKKNSGLEFELVVKPKRPERVGGYNTDAQGIHGYVENLDSVFESVRVAAKQINDGTRNSFARKIIEDDFENLNVTAADLDNIYDLILKGDKDGTEQYVTNLVEKHAPVTAWQKNAAIKQIDQLSKSKLQPANLQGSTRALLQDYIDDPEAMGDLALSRLESPLSRLGIPGVNSILDRTFDLDLAERILRNEPVVPVYPSQSALKQEFPERADEIDKWFATVDAPEADTFGILRPKKITVKETPETTEVRKLVGDELSDRLFSIRDANFDAASFNSALSTTEVKRVAETTFARQLMNETSLSRYEAEQVAFLYSQPGKATAELVDEVNNILKDVEFTVTTPASRQTAVEGVRDFSLYANPVASAFVVYNAAKSGMSKEEIDANLVEQGYEPDEIAEIYSYYDVIESSVAAGATLEQVRADLEAFTEPEVNTIESKPAPYLTVEQQQKVFSYAPAYGPKSAALTELVDRDKTMNVEQIVAGILKLQPTRTSVLLTSTPSALGFQEARQRDAEARQAVHDRLKEIAKEDFNLDLEFRDGEWYHGDKVVTPSLWSDIKLSFNEGLVGTAGAIYGAKKGAQWTPPVHPWAKPLGGALGSIVGAIGGATAGSQLDYMYQALMLHRDMEAEAMAYTAMNAAEIAAVGDLIGYPVAKGLGWGWRKVVEAKNWVAQRDSRRAYQSLKETTFFTDDQIEEMVRVFERNNPPLPGDRYEKGIQAVVLTQPGMQDLARVASTTDPKAQAYKHDIFNRTLDTLDTIQTDENTIKILTEDLMNYTADVKSNYAAVKAQASQSPYAENYVFDYDKLAIQPVLEQLHDKITHVATKEKYLSHMRRIQTLSESRKFGDLLELRQLVNDFLYNRKIVNFDDKKAIRGVIDTIDEAIVDGAPNVLENPQQWLDDWANARKLYTEMKQTEQKALYKAIFDKKGKLKPLNSEAVIKAMGRYIGALDGNFEEVMSRVPAKARGDYELAVVDLLANKFTVGTNREQAAIHFPQLAEELAKVSFTTKDARAAKQALMEMAEVFKNDVMLSRTAYTVNIPKFQSYLTIDPAVRAQYEVASGIFNFIKSQMPTASARQLTLVRKAAKLLENPLNQKAFDDVMKDVSPNANLTEQILKMRQEASKASFKQADRETVKIKVYAGGKTKGTGNYESIPRHRIATVEQAKEIADAEAIMLNSKTLDNVLKKYGFVAMQQGSDRVRIFRSK